MSTAQRIAVRHVVPLALLLLSGVCGADSDVDAIRAARMQSNEAIARHDAAGIESHLDENFVIAISTGAIERSREDHIRSFAEHFADNPDVIYVRTPGVIIISDAYPLAIERGTWVGSMTTSDGKLEKSGEYTAAWRKTDDRWRIYSELFVALSCSGKTC